LNPIASGAATQQPPEEIDAMKLSFKNIVLLVLMLLSAGLGAALRPTIFMANERPPIDLKSMVPTAFGDWQEQLNMSAQIVDPQQQETLDRIYSQVLTRAFVNSQGYRIMLSIAYGKNQSKSLELHSPEVCYPAQGFAVADKQKATLNLLGKPIAATRLKANLGERHEPITYWNVIGTHITTSLVDKRLIDLRYTLTGRIPDGLLVRVSSIDKATDNAYAVQHQFATELMQAIAPENRDRFMGDINTN
jgi:EpsI family protein